MTIPTLVNCIHAQPLPNGNTAGVQCGLGLNGGRPSLGVCRGCDKRQPIDSDRPAVLVEVNVGKRQAGMMSKIAHGAVGIAKAVTGTGGASDETIKARTAICNACPKAQLAAGAMQRCTLCGCATWAKVRNAGEQCPDTPPRWLKLTDANPQPAHPAK
jgi:hypothetical protein